MQKTEQGYGNTKLRPDKNLLLYNNEYKADLVPHDSISIGKDSGAHPSVNKSLQYVDSTSTVYGVM